MNDRLRELAASWKRKAGFSDGKGDIAFALGRCADELLSILDAEGDGGAVGEVLAWLEAEPSATIESLQSEHGMLVHSMQFHVGKNKPANRPAANKLFPLYTHPARSGVVRDEDVEAAIDAHNHAIYRNGNNRKLAMRAALEHFAKGERHER